LGKLATSVIQVEVLTSSNDLENNSSPKNLVFAQESFGKCFFDSRDALVLVFLSTLRNTMNTIVKSSILHNLARTSLRSRKTVKIFAQALSTKPDVANEYKGGYLKVGHWAEKSKQFLEADVSLKKDFLN
jgi:hypothetical protein